MLMKFGFQHPKIYKKHFVWSKIFSYKLVWDCFLFIRTLKISE